jgi:hypothetical protein
MPMPMPSVLFILTQEVLAQFKNAVLARLGSLNCCACLRLSFQVGEIGLAEWALDDVQMKGQVRGQLGVERIE